MSAGAAQTRPLSSAREHPSDCTITARAALERTAAQLRVADGARQTWLAALGTWDLLRTQHCRRGGVVCVDGRVASTSALAAAAGASRTTMYAHLRLLLAAGLVERAGAGWRLVGAGELEATREGARAVSHLHTWRPAHADALARLRAADPSGRVWRSVWGALVLIRHRARWDTGELAGDAHAIAAALGVKVDTWRSWQTVAAAAGLLDVDDQGVTVTGWARWEGLDEPAGDDPASPPAADGEGECSEFGSDCSEFGSGSVQSLGAPLHGSRAREALDVQAEAHPSTLAAPATASQPHQRRGGSVYDALTSIAARLPADQQPAVWASTALRRAVTGLLAIPGATPGQLVELVCRGSFAGAGDAVAVLVGHRAQVAKATLTAQAKRRAAAAAQAAEYETRRREQDQAAAREQAANTAAAAAAAALPSSALRAVLAADLATLDPQTPQVVRRSVPRAAAAVTACTRAAIDAWSSLPADRAVLASLDTADTPTPRPDDDATAAGLVDAVRSKLTATVNGSGR